MQRETSAALVGHWRLLLFVAMGWSRLCGGSHFLVLRRGDVGCASTLLPSCMLLLALLS